MHTQINIPTNSESGILPQQGSTNTFQKDKSKQELLEKSSVEAAESYNHIIKLEAGIKNPLDG